MTGRGPIAPRKSKSARIAPAMTIPPERDKAAMVTVPTTPRCSRCLKPLEGHSAFRTCLECRLRDREREKTRVRDRSAHDRRKYERRRARALCRDGG